MRPALCLTSVAAACVLAACGGNSDSPSASNNNPSTTYSGVVAAAAFVPGSATGNPNLKAGYYAGATVFVDANGNGVLDNGEASAKTDANGHFSLTTTASGPLVADITTSATNTASGAKVASHLILRASADQIADQGAGKVVISPMSSEVQRLVEANGTKYATEKANLSTRLSGPSFNNAAVTVSGTDALADVNTLSGAEQYAVLFEDNALTNRYTYATTKLDRGDMYPDNLAVKGGDPRLVGTSATAANIVTPLESQQRITFAQAQQAAFNIEGIPAYDNVFIIVEENKSTDAILHNSRAPAINKLLSTYNQLTTYYSTGNPSEPNYTAMGGADDYGITDDNWWGCGATGAYAIKDVAFNGGTSSDGQLLPATGVLPPQDSAHLAGFSTTSGAACSVNPTSGTVHNVPGDNLFTLLSKAGLTARTYSESMNPGQDARADSVAQSVSKAYSGTAIDGTVIQDSQAYPMPGGLYKVKHGPSIAFQDARSLPEFYADNRTIFGTQYNEADWKSTSPYSSANGGTYDTSKWIYDQFSLDLATGDVGNINFIVPDQCDDMHGVGTDTETCNGGANSNNGQNASITRADIYLNNVVTAIQNSALWKNPQKRVAIVVMFDEGEGSSTSCCGWNAGGKTSGAAPLVISNGAVTKSTAPSGYASGNIGHGNSIFGVITNQQDVGTAAKGIVDSDAYSHFSLVRTLQDMFQVADPAVDASYVNRAKYTEAFILQNIANLPEFTGSADTHFDSVRPINHAYVIPAGHVQKLNPADITGVKDNSGNLISTTALTTQTGPDATQKNIWSLK
ncbi:alkaline phosphatase family protein [Paraburkholderia youngii]|uniref:alkaline phosphatase family protein n=1 Tax=Paraburkholderia youngii TaxID=2782701 RepID=UPI003D20CDA7